MDSLIIRFRKIKNNRKNVALLQSCFKTAFFKKSPKDRLSKNRKRNILIILTRIHTRARARAYARTFLYIVFHGNVCPVDFDK